MAHTYLLNRLTVAVLALLLTAPLTHAQIVASADQSTAPTGTAGYARGPIECWYGYERHQNLYLASDLPGTAGASGSIQRVSFYVGTSATTATPIVVYILQSSASSLSSSTYASAITGATSVYSGSVTPSATGWLELTLSTAFSYDGISNLQVIVENNYGSAGGANYPTFAYTTTSTNRNQYWQQDYSAPTNNGVVNAWVHNVKLYGTGRFAPAGCSTPTAGAANGGQTFCGAQSFALTVSGSNTGALYSYQWQVESPYGSGTYVNVSGASGDAYTTPLLTGNTRYRRQIICTSSGLNAFSTPTAFTFTPITSYPYSLNFDGATCGLQILDANTDGRTWVVTPATFSGSSSPNVLRYSWITQNQANDWFFTPALATGAGKSYLPSFIYAVGDAGYTERFEIWYGTAPTVAGMTTQIYSSALVNNTAGVTTPNTIGFIPGAGTMYIGIKCTSPNDHYTLNVDNLTVTETYVAPVITWTAPAAGANVTTNPVALTSTATVTGSTITKVEYFNGVTLLGTVASSPYTYNASLTQGSYTLTAKATAANGQTASANQSFTVTLNQLPTVSFTAPTANQVVAAGSVTLTAAASDPDDTIAKVEFFEGVTLLATDNAAPFTQSVTLASGSHTITAKATDNAGGTASQSVYFVCNQPPSVTINTPTTGSSVEQGNILLRTSASDTDGSIVSVDYFVDGILNGSLSNPPFNYSWVANVGSHTIYARATDDRGFTTNSSTISVTITTAVTKQFFFEDFNSGSSGQIYLAHPNSGNNFQYWDASQAQGIGGTACIHDKLTVDGDFFATPLLSGLSANKEYAVVLNVKTFATPRTWQVFLNTSQSLTGAIKVDSATVFNPGTYVEQALKFTPPADGNYYAIIRHSGCCNYSHLYVDNVSVERNLIPNVSMTAPANNGSVNESTSPIVLTASATDDGSIAKVDFNDGATLVGTVTTSPYTVNFNNALPGVHTFTAKATDNHGNITTSTPVTYTVKFQDGTLSPYQHWSFNNGQLAPWTAVNDDIRINPNMYNGTSGVYYFFHIANTQTTNFLLSPKLFLQSGQTYTFEWRNKKEQDSIIWYLSTSPTSLAAATRLIKYNPINLSADFAKATFTFTVPSSGPYYLAQNTSYTGYVQSSLDEFRLIGNINSAPIVSITSPANNAVCAASAALTINVTASDPDGSIARVLFYAGSTYLGKDSIAPYNFTKSDFAAGTYAITAVAYDNAGGYATSSVVNLTIDANRVSLATYLGGSGSADAVRGSVIAPDGSIVLAANIGNSTPGGVTATTLGGGTSTSPGALVRIAADGKTVSQVVRLASVVLDLAQDSAGNLYVACGPGGVKKINAAATSQLFGTTFTDKVFRVDAGRAGQFACLTRPDTVWDAEQTVGVNVYVFSAANVQTATYAGASTWCSDVAVDSKTGTVITIGTKNVITFDGVAYNPVYIPTYRGTAFDGTQKYVGYNWSSDQNDPRWLNKYDNNMADTKAERCAIGLDGKLYIAYEVAGGNHPLRYDPFVNGLAVPNTSTQTNDIYSIWSNTTTAPKIFVGRYQLSDGAYLLGAQFTPRLPGGGDNTIRVKNGDIAADDLGRVVVAFQSAYGLPITLDFIPGGYPGGAGVLMFSPDLVTRELLTRYTINGIPNTVSIGTGGQFVLGGQVSAQDLFTYQPLQATINGTEDGFVVVSNYKGLYSWNPQAVHPRLFFSNADLTALRAKKSTAPFSSMLAKMESIKNNDLWGVGPFDSTAIYDVGVRIQHYAFLYLIQQNEAYAQEARKWVSKMINGQIPGYNWADVNLKGLSSYWMAKHVSQAYDWCFNSPTWDANYRYTVSTKLKAIADVIASNGGTEQNIDAANNWQGSRASSALLTYLAHDHPYSQANYDAMWSKLQTYISSNLGTPSVSQGWNVEGMNYTTYPWGNFVGPAGIALKRLDAAKDIRAIQSVRNTYWSVVASHSTALNLNGWGSLHPDWTDDDPNGNGEGAFGQGYYYVDSTILPQYKYAYDKFQGTGSPFGAAWDFTRAGAVWSYLYYPSSTTGADPMASSNWRSRFNDGQTGSLGLMTYRNAYQNGDDHVAQFKTKLRNSAGGHDGPDGLGFRIIGAGTCWATGGGRNSPGVFNQQATIYTANPLGGSFTSANRNTGTLSGTPLSGNSGGGHAIASLASDNLSVNNHKRWFVANYNSAATGADAVYIIGDESSTSSGTGVYWQMPTFAGNTVTITGANTFTITAPNGAVMKGTVLYPTGSPSLATGRAPRGSGFGDTLNNKWVQCQSSNGAYLVVLTIKKTGSQPSVSYSGSGVTGATVTVGTATFNLTTNDVIYGGGGAPRFGLDENLSLSGIGVSVYPNPAAGAATHLTVTGMPFNQEATYEITDAQGRYVASGTTHSGEANLPLGQAPGLYLVRLQSGGYTQTMKVVKDK